MPDPLREPGFLTEHQLRAVRPERDIFLTACPGSGKTRSGGVRVARLADDGLRVAACSYTNVHFCSRNQPDDAVGEDAAHPWDPELLLYPHDDPAQAVAAFRARLDELGHDAADAAVLARSNNLVDDLNGRVTPVEVADRPLAIGRAVSALRGAGTLGRRDLEAIDRIVAFCAWDSADLSVLEPDARWAVRQATMALLHGAPDLRLDLRSWIRSSATALAAAVAPLGEAPAQAAGRALRSATGQEAHVAGKVFVPVARTLRAQTVHDIKGESRSAVLVVVDRLRRGWRRDQGALWSRPLLGEAVRAEEAAELRIAFVALTRARRFCGLALPADSPVEVIDAFQRAGFRIAGAA